MTLLLVKDFSHLLKFQAGLARRPRHQPTQKSDTRGYSLGVK